MLRLALRTLFYDVLNIALFVWRLGAHRSPVLVSFTVHSGVVNTFDNIHNSASTTYKIANTKLTLNLIKCVHELKKNMTVLYKIW